LQERVQNAWGRTLALSNLGEILRILGDWRQARVHLERADQLRRALPQSSWATYVMVELGALCIDEGKREEGLRLVEDALTIARRNNDLDHMRAGERVLADLDLFEGRPEMARRRLEPLLDRPGLAESQVTAMLPTLSAAYRASGDLDLAEGTIQEGIERATSSHYYLALAAALLVRGRLMAARGRWTAAERDFEEAVRLAQGMPWPYLEARGRLAWGVTRGKQGERDAARTQLEEALDIFRRLGARPFMDRTQQALTELGKATSA
jgi:tetratricopeptide (TPR) repeat protein